MERFIDARVRGLAELIRSDSQALRRMIEEKTAEQELLLRETVEERMILVGEALVEKTAEAAEIAIASSLGETVERMSASMGSIEGIDTMLAEQQQAFEERMRAHVDDRVTAIARMIRSDNQALADRIRDRPARRTTTPSCCGRPCARSRSCTPAWRTTS